MDNGEQNYEHAIEIIEGLTTEDFAKFACHFIGEEYLMELIRDGVGAMLNDGKLNNLSKGETLLSIGISNDMVSRMEVLDGK
jgi:hypothetical protein